MNILHGSLKKLIIFAPDNHINDVNIKYCKRKSGASDIPMFTFFFFGIVYFSKTSGLLSFSADNKILFLNRKIVQNSCKN